ncbi:alpha/beta hydrolase [Paraburkholderia sp. IW21]|uniref:alpha/beta hydrolase n=1 Tax=Paraburkholderia sp. IW21 TaxID=3242488 RepID=UPI00352171DA
MSKILADIIRELESLSARVQQLLLARDVENFRLELQRMRALCDDAFDLLSNPVHEAAASDIDRAFARQALVKFKEAADTIARTDVQLLHAYLNSPSGKLLSTGIIEQLKELRSEINVAEIRALASSPQELIVKLEVSPPHEQQFVVARLLAPEREQVQRGVTTVWFATDRYPAKSQKGKAAKHIARFDDGRGSNTLSYGQAQVSFPANHQIGKIERPSVWKLQLSEDDRKHVTIKSCKVDSLSMWKQSAESRFEEAENRNALIFIHGYNVGFDEAIRRTAQIGFDIGFEGLLTCFSWSSDHQPSRYLADLDNADQSAPRLAEFLRTLTSELRVSSAHIIAHSMGNRVLLGALKELSRADSRHLREVVMAAPDVDCDAFEQMFPKIKSKAKRYTLYGSDKDKALLLSKTLRGDRPRLGDGGENIYVTHGVETLDASDVSIAAFDACHAYTFDQRPVLSDLHYVIRTSTPVKQRNGLDEAIKSHLPYWKFRV